MELAFESAIRALDNKVLVLVKLFLSEVDVICDMLPPGLNTSLNESNCTIILFFV